jgi:hypothetical protein
MPTKKYAEEHRELIKKQQQEYYNKDRENRLRYQTAYNRGLITIPTAEQKEERRIISKKNRKQYKNELQKRNASSWEGYIPKVSNCEICNRIICFNNGDRFEAIHFDHRVDGCVIMRNPSDWLRRHKFTPENIKIWESCNFGKLCAWCNRMLPTQERDRAQFIYKLNKYWETTNKREGYERT